MAADQPPAPAAEVLRFRPLQSCVDVTFWSELGNRKLDQYQLSETPIGIKGFSSASKYEELGSSLQVLGSSFNTGAGNTLQGSHAAPGQLLLLNTTEAFNRLDKAAAIKQVGAQIWADIVSGAAEAQPHLLSRFLLLAHGDLKHFVYTYWFAFTALKPPQPFTRLSAHPLAAAYPQLQDQMCAAADAWRADAGSSSAAPPETFCLMAVDAAAGAVSTAGLGSWQQLQQAKSHSAAAAAAAGEVLLVMFDPCCEPLTPGWLLRNALLLAAVRWGVRRLKVLCVRDSSAGRAKAERCFVVEVGLPEVSAGWPGTAAAAGGAAAAGAAAAVPEVLGWEANNEGKLKARVVDLSPFMSPLQLAEQAVDLNLRLMRWRAAPDLDIATLAATRCLLLGAGTLGCAVARALQAWGVRHITFVDSARVSYSNPVRQSLFTYDDCLEGGKPKATTQLQQLVSEHDVVFLLTDTRESRWLPTMLAAAAGKVAVTAALGFDTFLVMRHGVPQPPPAAGDAAAAGRSGRCGQQAGSSRQLPQQQLGCYFCNDVVAPLNSTIDRTLDQQCTVARPGLAPIAGSLAVEMMAALLQHPLRGAAPAPGGDGGSSGSGAGTLGPVPHMIRGQLSGFSQTCMVGQAFSQCTACSQAVLQAYAADGWGFLLKVLQQPGKLEELTGLAELHRQAAAMDLSSASSADEGEGGGRRAAAGEEEDWTEL